MDRLALYAIAAPPLSALFSFIAFLIPLTIYIVSQSTFHSLPHFSEIVASAPESSIFITCLIFSLPFFAVILIVRFRQYQVTRISTFWNVLFFLVGFSIRPFLILTAVWNSEISYVMHEICWFAYLVVSPVYWIVWVAHDIRLRQNQGSRFFKVPMAVVVVRVMVLFLLLILCFVLVLFWVLVDAVEELSKAEYFLDSIAGVQYVTFLLVDPIFQLLLIPDMRIREKSVAINSY